MQQGVGKEETLKKRGNWGMGTVYVKNPLAIVRKGRENLCWYKVFSYSAVL